MQNIIIKTFLIRINFKTTFSPRLSWVASLPQTLEVLPEFVA